MTPQAATPDMGMDWTQVKRTVLALMSGKAYALIGAVGFFAALIAPMFQQAPSDGALHGQIVLAQSDATAELITERLSTYRSNLQEMGLTTGYWAWIWESDASSLAVHATKVDQLIVYARELSALGINSEAYQLGMPDLRQQISVLPDVGLRLAYKSWRWVLWVSLMLFPFAYIVDQIKYFLGRKWFRRDYY